MLHTSQKIIFNNVKSFNSSFFFLKKGEGFMSVIENYTYATVVSGTSDADSIYNNGDDVSINTAAGNDTVYNNYGHKSKISLGAGNDSIYNH